MQWWICALQLNLNRASPGDRTFVSQVHCYIFRPRHWKVGPDYKPHCTLAANRNWMIPHRGQARLEFSGRLEGFFLFVCFVFPTQYNFLITFLHRRFLMTLHVALTLVTVWRDSKTLSDFLEEHQGGVKKPLCYLNLGLLLLQAQRHPLWGKMSIPVVVLFVWKKVLR